MVVKEANGYSVVSHDGKHLGGPYKTEKEALQRLAQIELFKRLNSPKKPAK